MTPAHNRHRWPNLAESIDAQDVQHRLRCLIALLDRQIEEQLNVILHHPRLQQLEALWRSVMILIETAGDDVKCKVLLLDARWADIRQDIERCGTVENSELYRKIHDEGFGIAGGEPLGLIVCAHWARFGTAGPDDIPVLRALAQIGAAAFVPFVLGFDPAVLGMESFAEHDIRRDIEQSMEGPAFSRWHSFRRTADSRYVCLAGPRLLVRAPGDDPRNRDFGSVFREQDDSLGDYLWSNAAFGVAQVVLRAHHDYRWAANIRGTIEGQIGGGVLDHLIQSSYPLDCETALPRPALDASVVEQRENSLARMGLSMARPCYFTPHVALFNIMSVYAPDKKAEGQPNLESALHYTLCVSRFAHYIKVMVRDWVGSHLSALQCEQRLQQWIDQFCNADSVSDIAVRARFPLRHAQISVEDSLSKPGSYHCTIWLRPHFQADQVISDLRLQTTLLEAA